MRRTFAIGRSLQDSRSNAGSLIVSHKKLIVQSQRVQESLERLVFCGKLLELLVGCIFEICAFVPTDLIFKACDVVLLSRATASLVVSNALTICSLFSGSMSGARIWNSRMDSTFPFEAVPLPLMAIFKITENCCLKEGVQSDGYCCPCHRQCQEVPVGPGAVKYMVSHSPFINTYHVEKGPLSAPSTPIFERNN